MAPTPKPRRSKAKVDLDRLTMKLRTVLAREVNTLMDASHGSVPLSKDRSECLRSYLRLVAEMKKNEVKEGAEVSEADLEKIARGE